MPNDLNNLTNEQKKAKLKKYINDYFAGPDAGPSIKGLLEEIAQFVFEGLSQSRKPLNVSKKEKIDNPIQLPQHKLDHIDALNQAARLAPTHPYSAILEYEDLTGYPKLMLSVSQDYVRGELLPYVQGVKESWKYFAEYNLNTNPDTAHALYEHLYWIEHPYIIELLKEYKDNQVHYQTKQVIDELIESPRSLENNERGEEEVFKKFAVWASQKQDSIFTPTDATRALVMKYDAKDLEILPAQNNIPHVEMYAIEEVARKYAKNPKVLNLNLGLAPKQHYPPSACGGCAAEINAIALDGIQVYVYTAWPDNIPLGFNYKMSRLVLESDNFLVYKSIIGSGLINQLSRQAEEAKKILKKAVHDDSKTQAKRDKANNYLKKLNEFQVDTKDAINKINSMSLEDSNHRSLLTHLQEVAVDFEPSVITVKTKGGYEKVKKTYNPLKGGNNDIQIYLTRAVAKVVETENQGGIDDALKYLTNLRGLLEEGEENHSSEELKKLENLRQESREFRKQSLKLNDTIKPLHNLDDFPKELPVFYSNGKISIILFRDENAKLKIYSTTLGDKVIILKDDVTYSEFKSFLEKFFSIDSLSGSFIAYKLNPESQIIIPRLDPDKVASDYEIFSQGKIPGVSTDLETLVELDLSNRKLRDNDIEKLLEIPNLKRIEKLNLKGNNITPLGLRMLIGSTNLPELREIDLKNNKLSTDFLKRKLQIISTLDKLDISENKLNGDQLLRISKAFTKITNIEIISDLPTDGQKIQELKKFITFKSQSACSKAALAPVTEMQSDGGAKSPCYDAFNIDNELRKQDKGKINSENSKSDTYNPSGSSKTSKSSSSFDNAADIMELLPTLYQGDVKSLGIALAAGFAPIVGTKISTRAVVVFNTKALPQIINRPYKVIPKTALENVVKVTKLIPGAAGFTINVLATVFTGGFEGDSVTIASSSLIIGLQAGNWVSLLINGGKVIPGLNVVINTISLSTTVYPAVKTLNDINKKISLSIEEKGQNFVNIFLTGKPLPGTEANLTIQKKYEEVIVELITMLKGADYGRIIYPLEDIEISIHTFFTGDKSFIPYYHTRCIFREDIENKFIPRRNASKIILNNGTDSCDYDNSILDPLRIV